MKRIIAVLTLVFLLSFIVSPLNATETRLIWDLDWEGINVKIYAPYQAYPNDTMTIRIRVEAREDLQGVTVHFKIYGSKSEGYLLWFRRLDALDNIDLSSGAVEDQYFDVDVPDSVDPGLLHGEIYCSWKVWRESSWQERSIDDVCIHRVTYLRNKPYEDIQVAYEDLQEDYNDLLNEYNTLVEDYDSLNTSYTTLLSDYDDLLTDYDTLQTSYNDLENSYSDLQANYSTLLTNHEELLANYNSLQSSFDSLQNDYNNLQTNYNSLNATYHSLLSNHSSLQAIYDSLQASFNELKSRYEFGGEIASTLNLMYVFIETTVIFIATTIYYARSQIYSALRKPKPKGREVVDVNRKKKQQT